LDVDLRYGHTTGTIMPMRQNTGSESRFDSFTRRIKRERAEIKPGKRSDTRIKPLALASGHGRYITVTPERALVSARGWPLHITATVA
jgi:hypothetical protein